MELKFKTNVSIAIKRRFPSIMELQIYFVVWIKFKVREFLKDICLFFRNILNYNAKVILDDLVSAYCSLSVLAHEKSLYQSAQNLKNLWLEVWILSKHQLIMSKSILFPRSSIENETKIIIQCIKSQIEVDSEQLNIYSNFSFGLLI
jgi:hypothetical protein